jgi:hypothetical protein
MATKPPTGAVNLTLVPVAEYATDPRGWGLFAALSAVCQRAVNGTGGLAAVPRSGEFTGYTVTPQAFTGMAPLGRAAPVVPGNNEIGDERSQLLGDTSMRIFAERLKRGA